MDKENPQARLLSAVVARVKACESGSVAGQPSTLGTDQTKLIRVEIQAICVFETFVSGLKGYCVLFTWNPVFWWLPPIRSSPT